jgi:DNA-binding response OmpR family regulator
MEGELMSLVKEQTLRQARPAVPAQRILVAEDDEDTRELVVTAFVEDGHDVYAMDGEVALGESLSIITRHSLRAPDLIAVGVGMAWHSGIDLVDDIRRAGWTTPVVLTTWFVPRNLRARLEMAGSAALVAKPFNMTELRSAARRARKQHGGLGSASTLPGPQPMPRRSRP